MLRLLLYLPLCMLMAPSSHHHSATFDSMDACPDIVADDSIPLPNNAQLEKLARDKPLEFLEACIRRYHRTVKSYTCTFQKQERIDGKLQKTEIIDIAFREQPYSVYFRWTEGSRLAERTLFVEGENDGMMLARPAGMLARKVVGDVVSREPEGKEARQSSRYTIKEFGLKKGALRTLASWKAAQENKALHVEFLGERKFKEVGDRPCYVLRRTGYEKSEEDGITEFTLYIDKETWFQVGSVCKGEGGKLIGEYFFRDIQVNPELKADQFKRATLTP